MRCGLNLWGRRLAFLAILAAACAAGAGAATMGLKETAEKLIVEYSASRRARPRFSGQINVMVRPFACGESFKQEDVGALVAEIIAQHLMGFKQIRVLQSEPAATMPDGADRNAGIQESYGPALLLTGSIDRRGDQYEIGISLLDRVTQLEMERRQITMAERDFHRMLGKYLRWKHRTWAFQPYLQGLYTERYLAEGYPSRMISSSHMGVSSSTLVETARMAIDETAEFTAGLRIVHRQRMMLDLAYTAHGHSTSKGQFLATMTNQYDQNISGHLLMYLSASSWTASFCGYRKLYGTLYGYAGAGWERTRIDQTVSSMTRFLFSGSGGKIEVKGYFLSPSEPLMDGGVISDQAALPLLRTGIEWRPGRIGFNFLATYRLGDGEFQPVKMAVEEVYYPNAGVPQQISYTIMDVTRYRLPRFSIGAAFTLSL